MLAERHELGLVSSDCGIKLNLSHCGTERPHVVIVEERRPPSGAVERLVAEYERGGQRASRSLPWRCSLDLACR